MKEEINNKYKIIITILAAILIIISSLFLKVKENNDNVKHKKNNSDAIKFKKEYESLNNKTAFSDYKYQKLTILESNPFKYITEDEAIKFFESGTGLIYLGYPNCPWCRNAVNVLQHVNASEIYYLDMTDIRDEYKMLNGKLTKTKNGSNKYNKLLKALDEILDEYEIEDDNGNKISTGEKRIYVPLVIGVLNGEIVGYHLDIVDLKEGQTAFDLLDNDQMEELKKIYDEIKDKVYDDTCGLEPTEGC